MHNVGLGIDTSIANILVTVVVVAFGGVLLPRPFACLLARVLNTYGLIFTKFWNR